MSDLSSTSYCKDKSCDNGFSPILLIMLLFLCGGGSCFSGLSGNNGCGCDGGFDGIMPILLLLLLGGGSFC